MSTIPTAESAFQRLKRELFAAKLSDKNLVEDLQCKEAHRRTYATAEIVRAMATRKMAAVEKPLDSPPKAASIEATLWNSAWPPARLEELTNRTIDLEHSYEIIDCPLCSATGRTRCGVCLGGGKIADANNPRKAVFCDTCQGKGLVTCLRCKGHSKLNRIAQITQTITQQKKSLSRPPNALGIPKTHFSGRLVIKQPQGFRTTEDARNSVLKTAVGLNPECVDEFSSEMRDLDFDGLPTRLGFLTLNATWHDGWELQCIAGGKPRNYFVPDTAANFIGPRLHSRKKLAWLGAAALGVLLTIGAIVNFQVTKYREAQELARSIEAARLLAEKEAHIQALKSELPIAIQEVDAAINATPDEQSLISLKRKLERFHELQPAPPEIIEKQNKLTTMIDELKNRREASIAAADAAEAARKADKLVTTRDWSEADDQYKKALELWDKHLVLIKSINALDKDTKIVRTAETEKSALEKKRQRIAPQVADAKSRIKARTQEVGMASNGLSLKKGKYELAGTTIEIWGSYKIHHMLFPDEEWTFYIVVVPRDLRQGGLIKLAKELYAAYPNTRFRFFSDKKYIQQYIDRDRYINDPSGRIEAVDFPEEEWVQNHLIGNINNRSSIYARAWMLEDRYGSNISLLP